jgi:hypothetical protein
LLWGLAQGFSPAKYQRVTRGFSPGPLAGSATDATFLSPSLSPKVAKNLSSQKADNPSNINKIHLQMSFTRFAKLVLEKKARE